MLKRLKFSEPLPKLILSGEKNTTWRVNDDKNIVVGDQLSLCGIDGTEFVKAIVISVRETTFGALTEEDKKGHEEFVSEQQLYDTYSKYYSLKVTPRTPLKVIKFLLL